MSKKLIPALNLSGNGPAHVDQTTFRSKANRDNAYLIDRAVRKTQIFTQHRKKQLN